MRGEGLVLMCSDGQESSNGWVHDRAAIPAPPQLGFNLRYEMKEFMGPPGMIFSPKPSSDQQVSV